MNYMNLELSDRLYELDELDESEDIPELGNNLERVLWPNTQALDFFIEVLSSTSKIREFFFLSNDLHTYFPS